MTDKQIGSYEKYQEEILNLFFKEFKVTELVKEFLRVNIPLTKVDSSINKIEWIFKIFENNKINEPIEKDIKNFARLDSSIQKLEKIRKLHKKPEDLFMTMVIIVVILIVGISIYINNYWYLYFLMATPLIATILTKILEEEDESKPIEKEILNSENFKYIKKLLLSRINYSIAYKTVFKFNDINIELLDNKEIQLPENILSEWTESELKLYFFIYAGNLIKQLNEYKDSDGLADEIAKKIGRPISESNKEGIRKQLMLLPIVYGNIHLYFLEAEENIEINNEFNFMKQNGKNSSDEAKLLITKYINLNQKNLKESKYFSQQLISISSDYKLNKVLETYTQK